MWARLSDPGTYQAFQHFITHAPWEADVLWKRLRTQLPERTGVLILDGTSFPKQGTASVGVARQYCGARGKVANCQTAVTVAPVDRDAGVAAGREPVLARGMADPRTAGARPRFPRAVRFAEKWRLAFDAAAPGARGGLYPDGGGRRCRIRRQRHTASHVASRPVALRVGRLVRSERLPGHARAPVAPTADRQRASAYPSPVAGGRPRRSKPASGRHGSPLATGGWSRGATARTPRGGPAFVGSGSHRLTTGASAGSHQKSGCCANATWGPPPRPSTTWSISRRPASLRDVVRLAHQRWAIEQQYQELKDELGLDHFEGRSWPGVATSRRPDGDRLQLSPERTPPTGSDASHAATGARRHPRGLDRPLFHDAAALSQVDAEAQRR